MSARERDAAADRPATPAAATIEAVAVPGNTAGIQIDGSFTEEVWARAPVAAAFVQRAPTEGAPPSHKTDVRVVTDKTALYIAIQAHEQEAGKIVGLRTRRDDASPSDWISVLIDSYHDRRSAFEFGVNAAGVKYDRYWFGDTNNDMSWDAVWEVAVGLAPDGWRAEFRIPLSQLRFNPGAAGVFGFAVMRTVAHNNEVSTWPLLARSASGFVSSFGDLTGLTLTGSQKRLELVPYAVGQLTTAPVDPANPLTRSPDPAANVGLDLKFKAAGGLTLTGTVNPDFGQVEADPAVVNLNGFETFFAERRPFFVEGSGNLTFGIECEDGMCTGLFYSRRIGRRPHRNVDAPPGGYVSQPSNTTILGATKITGRVGSYSIGILNAITGRQDARLTMGPDVATLSKTPVEPLTSYTAARVTREYADRSRLGFMVTSTNRRLTDELRDLPGSAVTGGVDADLRLGADRYSLTGFLVGSTVRGDAGAIADLQQDYVHTFQRPDSHALHFDPARTSLSGSAASLSVNKISGRTTRFSSNVSYKSPGFDINDLGYLQRADQISESNWFQIRRDNPGKHVRQTSVNFNQYANWNADGDRRGSGGNVNANWEFTNNWAAATGVNFNAQGFNDRLTRGGPGGLMPGGISQWGYFQSDNRRQAQGTFNVFWMRDGHGSSVWGANPGVTLRPNSALVVSFSVDVSHNVTDAQWVENLTAGSAPHYVFGRLNQTTVAFSTRVNYTITPTLTIQIYAQPFVSTGDYTDFRELVNGRAARYEDRFAPFVYGGNPNFNYHSFRTTNVVRWEYRPGSALFLVWQQGREDTGTLGDFRFGRDFGATFGAPATNVILFKFSRWINF